MRTLVNVVLLLATVVLVGLNVVLRIDPAKRHFELFPQMAHSLAYDSFAKNPNFADGKTLRPLVAGTIVRGSMPLHFKATPVDAQRAGIELVSNVRANDAKALARGKWVYEQFCSTCHGPFGKGDGIVATRGFPMPASLLAPRALQMRDGQMFHVLTYGQGNMPSYATQVGRDDRWKVIAYVRTLQAAAPPVVNPPGVIPSRQSERSERRTVEESALAKTPPAPEKKS